MDLLTRLDLTEAVALIRRRELTSVRYTQALLEQIEANTHLNAFITVRPDAVLDAAKAADRALADGKACRALHGIPVAVKDNIDTATLPTTGGTPALRAHQPTEDAQVVSKLRRAGALLLGKTNLHELAYGLTGDNAAYGSVGNPYAPTHFAGGSSAGSAAAVASGMAPAALGTDTGGSVRVPASLCGVAGLRPTAGRYSQHGVLLVSATRDTVGPIAKTVADLALLDSVLADTATAPETPSLILAGVRLGVVRDPFFTGMAPDLAHLMSERLTELAARGADLIMVQFPPSTADLIAKAGFPIAFYETPIELNRYLDTHQLKLELSELIEQCGSIDVKQLLTGMLEPHTVPIDDYRAAVTVHRPTLHQMLTDTFRTHRLDALVWPTTPLTAELSGMTEVSLGGTLISTFLAYTRTTNLGSIVGWPGVTIPAGLDVHGLPIGLALDGPPSSDRRLLDLAGACSAVFGRFNPARGC